MLSVTRRDAAFVFANPPRPTRDRRNNGLPGPKFLFPDALDRKPSERHIYLIKNGKTTPDQEVVEPKTLSIVARSIKYGYQEPEHGPDLPHLAHDA